MRIFNNISYEWEEVLTRDDFKSDEEYHFYRWLLDAERLGLVQEIIYQPSSFLLAEKASVVAEKQLKTKTKLVEKFLFHPHEYTPDFLFTSHSCYSDYIDSLFTRSDGKDSALIYVDTKGEYLKIGDDGRSFSMNQKWMWQRYGIYIQKIIPEKLFKKTWVPEVARLSPKKRQPVKKYIKCKTFIDMEV